MGPCTIGHAQAKPRCGASDTYSTTNTACSTHCLRSRRLKLVLHKQKPHRSHCRILCCLKRGSFVLLARGTEQGWPFRTFEVCVRSRGARERPPTPFALISTHSHHGVSSGCIDWAPATITGELLKCCEPKFILSRSMTPRALFTGLRAL
jgi:hypothetical protein